MGDFLDSALGILEEVGLRPSIDAEDDRLATMLDGVKNPDHPRAAEIEARVGVISETLRYSNAFGDLVRENIRESDVGTRYGDIADAFSGIREEAEEDLAHIADGKLDFRERLDGLMEDLSPWHKDVGEQFDVIQSKYDAVSADAAEQIQRENTILSAYADFRSDLKRGSNVAYELKDIQEEISDAAKQDFADKTKAVDDYTAAHPADSEDFNRSELGELELARDRAQDEARQQDRNYQLVKNVAEALETQYNVSEALMIRLRQTTDAKEAVYQRGVAFFSRNSTVFAALEATITSMMGLHESTQALEAMAEGSDDLIDLVAEQGDKLQREALKAGYGAMISPESVHKLMTALVEYQTDSIGLIEQYRAESAEATEKIGDIVTEGKAKVAEAIQQYHLPAA